MLKHRIYTVVFLLFLAGNSWGSGSPPTPTFDRSALISVLEMQSANYSPDLLTTLDDAVSHLSLLFDALMMVLQ